MFSIGALSKRQTQLTNITPWPISRQHNEITSLNSGILPRVKQTVAIAWFQSLKAYLDPTALVLAVDLMIGGSMGTAGGAKLFS